MSLDGCFGGPNDEIDWFTFDEESLEWSRQLLRGASLVVLGRRTFELFAKYWPTPEALREEPEIAQRLTSLPKLVFSRTLQSANWDNTRFVRGPIAAAIREEKNGTGGDIVLCGSSTILADLWTEGLVDEINIRVQPTVLGKGRPLFPPANHRHPLTLKESHRFQSGVTALRFSVTTDSVSG
jgi:dihydrofolate reductase